MTERSPFPLVSRLLSICATLSGRSPSPVQMPPAEAFEKLAERAVSDREPLPSRSVAGEPDFRRRLATYGRTCSSAPPPGYTAL